MHKMNFGRPIIWDLTFEISTPVVEIDCIDYMWLTTPTIKIQIQTMLSRGHSGKGKFS